MLVLDPKNMAQTARTMIAMMGLGGLETFGFKDQIDLR